MNTSTPTPAASERETRQLDPLRDLIREAISAAESLGHPLSGSMAHKRADEARREVWDAIDALEAALGGRGEQAQPAPHVCPTDEVPQEPKPQAAARHSVDEHGDCPHWCKACGVEEAQRAAERSAPTSPPEPVAFKVTHTDGRVTFHSMDEWLTVYLDTAVSRDKLYASPPELAAARDSGAVPLLLIAQGAYSDYRVSGPFRTLKTLNFAEAQAAFESQYRPANAWDHPNPNKFEQWLINERYIEYVESHEVHIGSYGAVELSKESRALTLAATPTHPTAEEEPEAED